MSACVLQMPSPQLGQLALEQALQQAAQVRHARARLPPAALPSACMSPAADAAHASDEGGIISSSFLLDLSWLSRSG
eukprot:362749-Chlamydomonas_euryale.AAC.5